MTQSNKSHVIPIFSVKDNPRVTFEENEYKEFLSAIRKCIKSGEIVRGHAISDEFYYFVCIIVHSYLRPTDREAFALTHKDITPNDDGTINLRVTKGKTGFRHSFSTELGLDFYNHLKRINCDYSKPDNFPFLTKNGKPDTRKQDIPTNVQLCLGNPQSQTG